MAKTKQIRAVVMSTNGERTLFDETWTGKKYAKELQKVAFEAAKESKEPCFVGYQEVGAPGWALWGFDPSKKYAERVWIPETGKYAIQWEQVIS